MNKYIQDIEKTINILVHNKKSLDLIFEYYGCMELSKKLNIPIYQWNDIPKTIKDKYNFPHKDTGCDGCSLDFSHFLQVKYYKSTILSYRKLSTFLAFEKFSTIVNNKKLYLIRLEQTKITNDVKHIINSGNIIDITIKNQTFLTFLNKFR